MQEGWLKLSVAGPAAVEDAVTDCFLEHGAVSVTTYGAKGEHESAPLFVSHGGEQTRWAECRFEGLFPLTQSVSAVRRAVSETVNHVQDWQVDFLAQSQWQDAWQQYAVDAVFGERLHLVPKGAELVKEPAMESVEKRTEEQASALLSLSLAPGLAFGSGGHPTTRMCLEWLAQMRPNWLSNARVLDYGCGSGILGLAALVLGSKDVTAVDIDPQALAATRENAAYNQLPAERVQLLLPDEFAVQRASFEGTSNGYDVVVANILANPLVELAPTLSDALARGGRIALAGLLEAQAEQVRAAYPIDLKVVAQQDDWVLLSNETMDGWHGLDEPFAQREPRNG